VVQDVSLDVSSGEVVGLLGPNGAGQDDLLLHDRRLIPVDAGSIHLDATELTHLPIHRRARLGISYLPQENSVFRRLTVEENVAGDPRAAGTRARRFEPRLAVAAQGPQHLAFAQARRDLALGRRAPPPRAARALATKPAFILLDEPFAGVDPNRRCSTFSASSGSSRNAASAS